MHVARRLLSEGYTVTGLDNCNPYYDPRLKAARIAELAAFPNFAFKQLDIADRKTMSDLFATERFSCVFHLAAQAGVRHSLNEPHAYVDANLVGFLNVLEGCRHSQCRRLLYASSSSVYGANRHMPFRTSDNVDHPLNLYGATKKANELMAHAYAHLFCLACYGAAIFHGLWTMGPSRRGDLAVR
jgi:UDP-glucuronate 4-epimerase